MRTMRGLTLAAGLLAAAGPARLPGCASPAPSSPAPRREHDDHRFEPIPPQTHISALALLPDGRRALLGFLTVANWKENPAPPPLPSLALWDLEAGREL